MPDPTSERIRRIFLNPRPNVALLTAAELLAMSMEELTPDMEDGVIVAGPTRLGVRISKEELIAEAMRLWERAVIEEAFGKYADLVLPEARAARAAAGAGTAVPWNIRGTCSWAGAEAGDDGRRGADARAGRPRLCPCRGARGGCAGARGGADVAGARGFRRG